MLKQCIKNIWLFSTLHCYLKINSVLLSCDAMKRHKMDKMIIFSPTSLLWPTFPPIPNIGGDDPELSNLLQQFLSPKTPWILPRTLGDEQQISFLVERIESPHHLLLEPQTLYLLSLKFDVLGHAGEELTSFCQCCLNSFPRSTTMTWKLALPITTCCCTNTKERIFYSSLISKLYRVLVFVQSRAGRQSDSPVLHSAQCCLSTVVRH